ncbi:ABC-type multidrug transport system, ATPase and permease component [Thermobacillus composti KWC4]|uniref:ABC-type multidrug transport system, ATPase and permease component n=1 Tax=Thermobacillus composti (strain DSM 18247 / JCM 13945 / KWC4) TaxID=717605 RepID=L0E844_THECK|nr:ATP-binding cassette domain-containing protein [Thermobacillus composti]AGA56478.1 ABC-type multidrug transport system, ATPase and permease component [Thermobacillus composti KWC4]
MWLIRSRRFVGVLPWMIFTLVVTLCAGALPGYRIYLFGSAIEQIAAGRPESLILFTAALFATATIAEKLLDAVSSIASEGLHLKIRRIAREEFMDRFGKVEYVRFLDEDYMKDAEKAASSLGRGHRLFTLGFDVLRSGAMLVSLIVALFFVTEVGALVMLAALALIIYRQMKLGRAMFNLENELAGERIREKYYRSVLLDGDLGKERALFRHMPYIVKLWRDVFREISGRNLSFLLKSQRVTVLLQIGQLLLITGVYVAVILTSKAAIGGMIIAFKLVDEMLGKANAFVLELRLLTQELLISTNLMKFLRQPVPASDHPTIEIREEIELSGVGFRYPNGTRDVLSEIDMRIGTGRLIGLVGPNGAGKTTLCHIISGLLEPTRGEVRVDGRPVAAAARLGAVAVAYADFAQFPLAAKENIGFMNEPGADAAGMAEDILRRAGERRIGQGYTEAVDLSGGEWQRLAVARAISNTKTVVLLDEPTAAMDPITEGEVVAKLKRFVAEGKAAVLVAHRVSTVMQCDIVYVMRNGTIAQVGSPKELIREEGIFRDMYGAQVALLQASAQVESGS